MGKKQEKPDFCGPCVMEEGSCDPNCEKLPRYMQWLKKRKEAEESLEDFGSSRDS